MEATQEHEPEHGVAWRTSDERSGRSEVDRLDMVAKAESHWDEQSPNGGATL